MSELVHSFSNDFRQFKSTQEKFKDGVSNFINFGRVNFAHSDGI